MQRLLIAAVLLGVTGVAARADYFIIKVNLASTKDKKPDLNAQNQQPGASGLMPGAEGMAGAGALGMPGSGFGGPGLGGKAGAGMGMGMGPGGMSSGRPPGGAGMGAPGGNGPGAGMGMGMGLGGRGGMGRGGMGLGGRGGMGMGMGPGMGIQGGMNMAGGGLSGPMGGMNGPAGSGAIMNQMLGDDEDVDSKELFVGTIVEVKAEDVKLLQSGRWLIKNNWGGKTHLFIDNNDKEIEIHHIKLLTVAQQYAREKARLKGVDLALWALSHGLYDEVSKIMDELLKNEPKNPIALLFQKTEAALAKDVKGEDSSLMWRDKLGEFKEERSKHYVLCFDTKRPEQAQQRLKRLENNLRGFYYWFALHGKALPVPEKRLVAFLVDDKEVFLAKHKDIFDDDELVADGFYDRHENIAVYSAHRLDDAYAALDKITGPMWKSMNFNASDLLKGKSTPGVTANENARAQTLTLLQKGMQEESELNSVSFEGTRQLLEVVGYLPKSVEIPRWFDFGMASIFEIPKGAFWHGTGSQNQAYVAQFQIWDEQKKLDKPAEVLLGVVTDKFFRRVEEAKNKENSENRARTLAWMLSNYLSKKKLDGMVKYCAELRQLPRDIELNEEVLALTFARAFDLCEAGNPDKIDQGKWMAFANGWFKSAREEVLEVVEVKNLRRKASIHGKAGLSTDTDTKPGDPGSFIK